jgi:hypothetical protein
VNEAIQDNQIDCDESEANVNRRCQCQRHPDEATHTGHVDDEDSQRGESHVNRLRENLEIASRQKPARVALMACA